MILISNSCIAGNFSYKEFKRNYPIGTEVQKLVSDLKKQDPDNVTYEYNNAKDSIIKHYFARETWDKSLEHNKTVQHYPYSHHIIRIINNKPNLFQRIRGIKAILTKITIKTKEKEEKIISYQNRQQIKLYQEEKYPGKRYNFFTIEKIKIYKKFKFEHYNTANKAKEALLQIHPIVSDVSDLVKVLEVAGAIFSPTTHPKYKDKPIYKSILRYSYRESELFGLLSTKWIFIIALQDNNSKKIKRISISSGIK